MFDYEQSIQILLNYSDCVSNIINSSKNLIRGGEQLVLSHNGSYIMNENDTNSHEPMQNTIGFKYAKEYGNLIIKDNAIFIESRQITYEPHEALKIEGIAHILNEIRLRHTIFICSNTIENDYEYRRNVHIIKQQDLTLMLDIVDAADDIIKDIQLCTVSTKEKLSKLKKF